MEIKDIDIKTYFSYTHETIYDSFVDTMKPINRFAGKSCQMNKLTFDEVQVMKSVFSNPNLEDIMDLFIHLYQIRGNIKQPPQFIFLSTSVFELFSAKRFLQEWIQQTVEKEVRWLSDESEDDRLKMINAQERLKPFSHLLTKIKIAQMFGVTPSDVGGWKYSLVFTILVANKVKDDLFKEYNEIT